MLHKKKKKKKVFQSKGSQASPAFPVVCNSIKMNTSMEHWENDAEENQRIQRKMQQGQVV
jgi:hypothetical protein